jgi:hypothetical protein
LLSPPIRPTHARRHTVALQIVPLPPSEIHRPENRARQQSDCKARGSACSTRKWVNCWQQACVSGLSDIARRISHHTRTCTRPPQLYTTDGNSALELFSANPDLFDVYHQGFQTQVEKWPVNPVDRAIEWITSRDKGLVVVDLGCGEAALAQSVPNQVHSFDLISPNEHGKQAYGLCAHASFDCVLRGSH